MHAGDTFVETTYPTLKSGLRKTLQPRGRPLSRRRRMGMDMVACVGRSEND